MDPIPLPPPYGGVNENIPILALDSPQCENLLNFNINQAGLVLRNGDSIYSTLNGVSATGPTGAYQANYGNSKLYAVAYHISTQKYEFYDVDDSNNLVYTTAATGAPTYISSFLYDKYLYFFFVGGSFGPGYYYDGASFGVIGYTGSSLSPRAGNVYGRRQFIIQDSEAAYWYSGIDSISGALTKVDLNSIISENSTLRIIASVTIADNIQSVTYQSFIFDSGEVLFYSGSYPDGNDWGLVGRAKIGEPLGYGTGMQYQGDYLVFCDTGVISLRDLFLKGSEDAANLTVNSNIQKTWRALIAAAKIHYEGPGIPGAQGVWDKANDRLIISFPGYVDDDGAFATGSFYFIFFNQLQSWCFHRSFGPQSHCSINYPIYYNQTVLLFCESSNPASFVYTVYEKEGSATFMDRISDDSGDIGYDFQVRSAPIPRGSDTNRIYSAPTVGLIRPGMVHTIQGMDVIINSDLYAETNYYLIGDLGVTVTSPQTTNAPEGSLQKPFVNIGSNNTYVQYKISGTTVAGKTTGLLFYGCNVWLEGGDTPR